MSLVQKLKLINLDLSKVLRSDEPGAISYNGDVDWSKLSQHEIPVRFDVIAGDFKLSRSCTNLIKFPREIKGDLHLTKDQLTMLRRVPHLRLKGAAVVDGYKFTVEKTAELLNRLRGPGHVGAAAEQPPNVNSVSLLQMFLNIGHGFSTKTFKVDNVNVEVQPASAAASRAFVLLIVQGRRQKQVFRLVMNYDEDGQAFATVLLPSLAVGASTAKVANSRELLKWALMQTARLWKSGNYATAAAEPTTWDSHFESAVQRFCDSKGDQILSCDVDTDVSARKAFARIEFNETYGDGDSVAAEFEYEEGQLTFSIGHFRVQRKLPLDATILAKIVCTTLTTLITFFESALPALQSTRNAAASKIEKLFGTQSQQKLIGFNVQWNES